MTGRDPRRINADLHSHSVVSDGMLAPAALVARAAAGGVELFALTDHDEVGGLAEAADAAARCAIGFVPGVEISVSWGAETVHVLGLNIDPENPVLLQGLAATRSGRDARARQIARQLDAVGITDAYEGALGYAGNPAMISRAHFARHIVAIGRSASVSDVFGRYLSPGRPGFVPHRWAELGDAVHWIRGAGGTAVIAHPGRYALDALGMDALIDAFVAAGGAGIEVISGAHARDEAARYASLARRHGLLASRGSDFHSPNEGHVELGALAQLPASVEPVWSRWAH
ncbi:MAG: PHP domain-containing protein [Burkholderiales bacterium]|nr:MAG: PHP domain-containing protein [Burkholderiales bacterium]